MRIKESSNNFFLPLSRLLSRVCSMLDQDRGRASGQFVLYVCVKAAVWQAAQTSWGVSVREESGRGASGDPHNTPWAGAVTSQLL